MAPRIVDLAHDTHADINQLLLFRAGSPLIENLANLDQLTQSRRMVYALPVPERGLDAFPLWEIAMEG